MKKKHYLIILVIIHGISYISCNQNIDSYSSNANFNKLNTPYFGQKPPDSIPEIFAPGLISNGLNNGMIFFTNNGTEVIFSSGFEKPYYFSMVFHSFIQDGNWTHPKEVPVKRSTFHRPVLSPDGKKIFFLSSSADKNSDNVFIYYIERNDKDWSVPQKIDFGNEFPYSCSQVSIANSGNIYFQAGYHIYGNEDIYISKYKDGKYLTPEKLGDKINSSGHELHPCISPDESLLIFDANREEGYGNNDLYISFYDENSGWSTARNMGGIINSPQDERRSSLSSDGKYLFYESSILIKTSQLPKYLLTYQEFCNYAASFKNGSTNIYWVDTKFIDEMKQNIKKQTK